MGEPVDILVVDDDERNLIAVESIIADLGDVTVVKARSGEQALRLLLAREFPLVILDVHMPGLDGFETASILRSAERTRHIPVIFLTANDDRSRAALGYAKGAVDYLVKPIVPEVLRAKVSAFVELYRAHRLVAEMRAREHAQELEATRRALEAERLMDRLAQERALAEELGSANRRLELALEATRRALGVREEFLRLASHELRTPLTSMRLTLENAVRYAHTGGPESGARVTRALRVMGSQLERLSRLAEELLSTVVIQQERLRLAPQVVNVPLLVRAVLEELQYSIQASECEVSAKATRPFEARWDPFWIQQALANLLTNALKFGAGRPIEVMVDVTEDAARIAVRDQGIGIAPSDRERIFQPFERAVPAENYGGLGLGLYIVRRIVEDHGGTVSLESAVGAGSTFLLELPLGLERQAARLEGAVAEGSGG